MAVGNEALQSGKWNSAWRQNVYMAAGYMECILYVKNCKHGDDVNSEVTTDLFLFYRVTRNIKECSSNWRQHLCGSVHQWAPIAFLSSSVCNCLLVCWETEMAGSSCNTCGIHIVFLLLCLCILIACLCIFIVPAGTLRLPWLRFFRAFSSDVRQMPGYNSQKRGTTRTIPKMFVLFYILFVLCRSVYCLCVNVYCTVLLPPGVNSIAV